MPRAGESNIGYLINQAGRLLTKQLNARLEELDLTQPGYALLRSVTAIKDRPVTISDIADDLRMDNGHVMRAVDLAVQQGWLLTEPHPEMRRALILKVSDKTKAVMPAITDAGHWTLEAGLNGFTHEEIDQLRGYLQRLVRNLEAAEG